MAFLNSELEFFILCLSTLFTLINPLGITPIFIVMTERFSPEQRKAIAQKAVLSAGVTLLIFSAIGHLIFRFYGITIEAFQIMGGIIFFRNGLNMLEAKVGRSRTTPKEQEESRDHDEIAVSPIGIPLITGPGAITAAMLLSGQIHQPVSYGTLAVAIFVVLLGVYLILRGGDKMSKKIGQTGMRIIERIMGLILMVIAVQFIINGVKTVVGQLF